MAADIETADDEAVKQYERQISNLKREVARLKKTLASQAAEAADDAREEASEVYETVRRSGAQAARAMGRRAQEATDSAIEHPVISLGVLAGIGVLVGILLARRD